MSDVKDGPLPEADRECRDTLCCILFLVAIGMMVFLSISGYQHGNLDKPWRGVDENGRICGDENNAATKDYPYVYYYSPKASTSARFCVNNCPQLVSGSTITTPQEANTGTTISWNYQSDSTGTLTPSTPPDPTASQKVGYDTTITLNRFCVPSKDLFDSSYFQSAKGTV